MAHLTAAALEGGLDHVRAAPSGSGTLELIVRRPGVDAREVLEEGRLDLDDGLVGDTWRSRGNLRMPDGAADPEAQLTVMSARAVALLAVERERWALAGDQLYVDLDLSEENLPAGTRLRVGEATIEVAAKPHRGCAKFARRYGPEALRFVNSEIGAALRLRGLNAKVVEPGLIRRGDLVTRLA